ncbi:Long-chain-fatty-acid--CoA ligase [Paraburkholderia domus]|uniref:Long-chain-fatty-acid--CoA ligase n=1 Tax=Paraburkholderia domus TaxID=2793075 RepID=A0A9N8N0V3_9BURK|nr:long-chain fatty acid--CoA ligase [Paraburkholderia domus]MBK5050773.1 long-chain fatty acid--CoA ligase [Burkholderia sp. R-70006]MBK5059553.1 long-chain fatty acid--CoA ligase [Burkholderia sp. R-70199]MBK5086840.1 long-chain fatty acid--CoA ligase [Burkholderia sp. R-69927]MBK5167694.1 long-chain fatty acid--CoA ligase [Burkholderia sp. R-70211]MBK5183210.1 long-chain fatty acid--CoA ligase [Burkholderia sp. R-69749]MCI0152315.1 long-chain-fatty-acid--CoA ligase [Paraburkholderia sedimi
MDKIWLKSYPPGVPAEIDPTRYSSVAELLEEAFRDHRTKPAFVCMGKEISYGELDALSRKLAAWFQSKGLARGARIAIMMPNVLQYPVAIAAILRAGYVVVNVNPLYTPRELEHQLKDSGAEAIILLENFATTLQAIVRNTSVKHVVVAAMGDLMGVKGALVNFVVRRVKKMVPAWSLPGHVKFNTAIAEGSRQSFKPVQQGPDDVAFLQYTGGTTGVAKGATLLHRNLIANVLQSEIWLDPVRANRTDIDQFITVVALPLYHVFALTVCGLLTIRTGGLGVLIPNPRDIPGMIKALEGYPITTIPAVNTLYNAMLNSPDFHKLDFSKLIAANGGGMAVQEAVAKRWFELTHTPIIEGYGLSETSPCVTCNPVTVTEYSGTIGLPLPSTEISIRDDEGNEVPLGQPGEICIRGPQVMAGYWNRPDETAKVMTPDGFFKSGDVGLMNENGFVKIVDRKKDMILVSGFNVYPNEIEDVVAKMPGVFEVAAVGVPDQHSGEAVKLFVVKKDQALTDADIFTYCKTQLTGYKRPKIVEFRTELPKSNVGKILRRELRDGRA